MIINSKKESIKMAILISLDLVKAKIRPNQAYKNPRLLSKKSDKIPRFSSNRLKWTGKNYARKIDRENRWKGKSKEKTRVKVNKKEVENIGILTISISSIHKKIMI